MDERFVETGEATQEAMRAEAQARISSKAFSTTDLEPDKYERLNCEDCEVPLPVFRMQKGFTRCTACQTTREKVQARSGA